MTNFYRLFKKIPRYFLLLACAMKFCGRQLKEYRILLWYPALLMLILPMYELLCKMTAPLFLCMVLGGGKSARKVPRRAAINSPLIDLSINGARGVLFTVA